MTPHPFRIPAYRSFWFARCAAMLAQGIFVIVLGWAVYEAARGHMGIRAGALRIGLIGLVQFLPMLVLNPVAGLAADHFDRRLVVRLSLVGQMAAIALLLGAEAGGPASLGLYYLAAALFAAARVFYMPAMNALMPQLVPAEVLPRAIALAAIAGRIGGIAGPMIGGYAWLAGPQWAYGSALALLAVSLLAHLMIARGTAEQRRSEGAAMQRLAEGLSFVRGNRLLLGAISLDLFAMLFAGATALLPVYARDILHVGASGLGILRAATSMGAVSTAVFLSWRRPAGHVGHQMLGAVVVFGVATIGFAVSRNLVLSVILLAVAGAADMISVYVRQTLVQIATPDEMRGRVGAISTLFIVASNELGEMESGLAAALLGPVGAVVAGGAGAILVAVTWARIFPELRRVSRLADVSSRQMPNAARSIS